MPSTLADDSVTMLTPDAMTRRQSKPIIILPASSDFARSHVANWSPSVPITPETEALRRLKTEWKRQSQGQPVYDGCTIEKQLLILDLQDFEIYRALESATRAYELISLHYLEVPITKKLCFDGFVCLGATQHYVQAIPIQDSSVEGYGDEGYSRVTTYIQSALASKDSGYDIWYRLNRPAPSYNKFQTSFLWVTQLGKHVIDYLESQPTGTVGLKNLREDFHHWLVCRFAHCADFEQWHVAFRHQTDFRVGVHAYIDYFYNQAFNLPNSKQLLAHPLWSECMAKDLTAVERQELVMKRTIATPEVFNCFKDMYFGEQLEKKQPVNSVQIEQQRRKRKLGFAKSPRQSTMRPNVCQPYGNSPVRVGDVVALIPDETDSRVWRNTDWEWLAYVQATELSKNGAQRLFVLWVYRHHETNIFKATYPYNNEVFLSDNCNCTEGELLSTDIKGWYNVDWSPSTIDADRFFIRQTYVTQDSAFVSVRASHKTCTCRTATVSPAENYHRGDTVYLAKRDRILDPVAIQHVDQAMGLVTVRKLLRIKRDCAELATKAGRRNLVPNELVLTNDYEEVAISCLQRRCFVKFVSKSDILNDRIPSTYNCGGAGDLWFLSMGLSIVGDEQNLVFLRRLPKSFNEGPSMTSSHALRGMSLFSGGGSLDRGLEEGGAVTFHTAVDFSQHAIHTQRANSKCPEKMSLFCGSIDDHFFAALKGEKPKLVPRVGEVEFIAAGSPCPGFSTLQKNFLSEQSLHNASHISTFCSYADLYRPLYGILENVVNMASTRTGYEDQNVLSQVVACLVSMGYQCNQYIMDAWSYGSAQQRSRLILTIAAPGLEPIAQPWHTHARPYEETFGKSLGYLPNGQRFGEREHYATPFASIKAVTVSAGLPNIGNGIVQTCIPFPDHRVPGLPRRKQRALVRCIPREPPGCGYKEANQRGFIPTSLKDARQDAGRAFKRIKANGLVPCITTKAVMRDSRNSAVVHWDEHRTISVLEARRTQGFMDEEPIIGSLIEQYKIVGNGVDRKVAFAMGLALFQAVEKNDSGFTANGTRWNSASAFHPVEKCGINADPTFIVRDTSSVRTEPYAKNNEPVVVVPRRSRIVEITKVDESGSVTSQSSESLSSDQQNSGFFSRLPRTFTTGIGRLSLSNMASSRPAMISTPMISTPMKRSREDNTDDIAMESESRLSRERPGKQPRVSKTPPVDNATSAEAEKDRSRSGSPHSHNTGSSMSTTKSRQTRHSGLSVEFVPKNWDRRPEADVRKCISEE